MPDKPTVASATTDDKKPGCVTVSWQAPPPPATSPAPPAGAAAPSVTYEVVALPTMSVHTTDKVSIPICGLEGGARYSFEIRAVIDGVRSDPVTATPEHAVPTAKPSAWWVWTSWGLTVAFLVAAGVAEWAVTWSAHTRHGVAFACVVIAVGLSILSATGGKWGAWRAVIGVDGRVSTSYVTTALWTLLVVFALAYMTARTWFHHEKDLFGGFIPGEKATDKATTTIWDDYLILLGGPFAALVTARGIVSSKVQNQTMQKTLPSDGTADLRQALNDDSGALDLVDSQYLLFNIVALAYVIVGLASTTRLPAIPAVLLALTSSSAATYVLNKAVQNQRPTITGVLPSSFRPGERIVITGSNLMPAGPNRPPLVSIGGKQALVDAKATNAQITAVVPAGVPAGMQQLIVTTAARAETEARPVEVLADQPQILAIEPPVPTRNQDMLVRGLGFRTALDTTSVCSVKIGDAILDATPTKLASGVEQLKVEVPANTDVTAPVDVVVLTARGMSSTPQKVSFKAS